MLSILSVLSGCVHINLPESSASSASFTIDAAYQISKQVKTTENRVWLLREIAAQHFELGDSVKGKQILDETLDLTIRTLGSSNSGIMSVNLGDLVSCYLANGFIDSAMKAAENNPNSARRRSDLASVAVTCFQQGLADQADSIVSDIIRNNDENDFDYLFVMASYYTRTNQRENALRYLDKCSDSICAGNGNEAEFTVKLFLQWDLTDDAELTMECIDQPCVHLVSALCFLAVYRFNNQNATRADENLSQASRIGEKVFLEEPVQYDTGDMAFSALVNAHASFDQFEAAESYAERMHREYYRSGAWTWIGERYIASDNCPDALRMLGKIRRETETVWLMQRIVKKFHQRKYLDEMMTVVNAMETPLHRTRCLAVLAEAYQQAGADQIAERLITQAVKTIPKINYVGDRAWALSEISDELHRAGLTLNAESRAIVGQLSCDDGKNEVTGAAS